VVLRITTRTWYRGLEATDCFKLEAREEDCLATVPSAESAEKGLPSTHHSESLFNSLPNVKQIKHEVAR
jgi:hypothetical protein